MKEDLQQDVILPFSLNEANIKGKILRLNQTSAELLNRFSTNIPEVDKVFLDSLTLSQLISSNFKFEGTFKLQLNGDGGIIKMILCDNKVNGNMRAYLSLHEDYTPVKNPSFKDLIGEGVMIFHLYLPLSSKPYQAIVDLNGDSLSDSAYNWFKQSEQTKSYIKIFSSVEGKSTAGLFLQKIPNQYASEEQIQAEEEVFNTLKILSDTLKLDEILNDDLEHVLYKLYNEFEVITYDKLPISYKCTCSDDVIKEVISAMSLSEQESIRKENNGEIKISCSFCGKEYSM
ncbi:MAG: Hsp33 family molecular chaperone HslO [Alphaproteobacteria bacterium]|jgi:molecular chaperone Hsp33|nr:Hsp33 family molecular chaperone HslO [Alphaproteobacteria bacterium]